MTFWHEDRTLFLVEEGQANQGDLGVAIEMIKLAAKAGADAIEFQFGIADDLYPATHPNHALYRASEYDPTELAVIAARARGAGLIVIACPLSDRLPAVLVEAGYDGLTINSSDVTNPRLIDAVAATSLPVLAGTAMAELAEIDWIVERLAARALGPVCILHGQHVMTTKEGRGVPESGVSLATISFLRDRYQLPVGFIDHTSSVVVPALAAAHGAAVVTKHLAPRVGWTGSDAHICLTPSRMAECIRLVRLADETRGAASKHLASGERADRVAMRRSVVAAHDLPAGIVLAPEHLALKRPGTGLDPRELEQVIGATLQAAVGRDEPICLEDLS